MKVFSSIAVSASLTLGLGLMPAPVRAAEPRPSTASSSLEQLNEEGATLYAARDYRRAIEKFIQAYAIEPDPNLLFNIARCYEELGEADAAIEKYETFLKTPGADTRGQKRARESLAALREGSAAAPAASPAADASPPASEPAPGAASGEHAGAIVPWLTLGGSAVFAALGTTFYLLGKSDHDQVTDARGFDDAAAVSEMTHREADDLVSSGDTKKLIGGISFGLAGALAATYVVLVVTRDDESTPERQPGPSLGLSLAPARGGAAVLLQGSM
jgi:tetratricopeptide (TPR) repeat protein